jgi:hypothetical protein
MLNKALTPKFVSLKLSLCLHLSAEEVQARMKAIFEVFIIFTLILAVQSQRRSSRRASSSRSQSISISPSSALSSSVTSSSSSAPETPIAYPASVTSEVIEKFGNFCVKQSQTNFRTV